ncbi:MAG: Flp family type IVb pilin [Novosphingobium sp.]|nr:Flp family type IVb pilin [Novosphingobium sp.]
MVYETLKLVRSILRDQKGLTAVEYAVLGGIIVAAIGVAAGSFQGNLSSAFNSMFSTVS